MQITTRQCPSRNSTLKYSQRGTFGDIIGKYKRGENIPSIDVAAKIADALGVTLDYLVKDGEYERIDNETLKKLKEIQNLDPENKSHVFATIDAFISGDCHPFPSSPCPFDRVEE